MADINWRDVWKEVLSSDKLFPAKIINKDTASISCPTRFSSTGEFAIEITPLFDDKKKDLTLKLLVFNDNLSVDEIVKDSKTGSTSFNSNSDQLVKSELSNRLEEKIEIKPDELDIDSDSDAVDALIKFINTKAGENGNMFDDKLDEINENESYNRTINSIREGRRTIFKKVEEILKSNYKWRATKNEDFSDSTASFTDRNGNLAAVVSLVDDCIIVDIAKGITAKVSMLQSDEAIEDELTSDIDAAEEVLANREVDHLKDIIDNSEDDDIMADDEYNYLESLERKVTRLESLYIRSKLHRNQ